MSAQKSQKPLIVAKQSPVESPETSSSGIKLNITKKYVLPPRPKPGRKPSSETPPNRRKAQNREAQRAFRERRAVAVQDLEERLGLESQKHAKEQKELKDMIAKLMKENACLKQMRTPPSTAASPMSPVYAMMSPNAMSPNAMSPNAMSPNAMSPHAVTPGTAFYMASPFFDPAMDILDKVLDERLPVPAPIPKGQSPQSPRTAPSPRTSSAPARKLSPKEPPTFGLKLAETNWEYPAVPLRRRLSSLETDFTHSFKRKLSIASMLNAPSQALSPQAASPCRPTDRCGFCTDDTPCVCMEAAARERANMRDIETLGDVDVPSSRPHAQAHLNYSPGSPVTVVSPATSSVLQASPVASPMGSPVPPRTAPSPLPKPGECTGDPGSCTQCQDDPMSTLFCTTVAAKPSSQPQSHSAGGTFIPAQAAYRTLSRHRQFSAADFSSLVSELNTRGTQVEVNSVAKVLRMLDKKLYD